jgi:tetratricopeptide (TPR) repeat protein
MGGRRFRMLETVMAVRLDRLRDSASTRVRDRHLACFRRLAARGHELKGRTSRFGFDDCVASTTTSPSRLDGARPRPTADASLELSAGLHLFWFKHGHLNEARRWLKPALARPASETVEVKSLTAECWFALGLSTILTGSTDEGRHCLETSLRLARELGDDGLAVVVLRMFVQGLVEVEEIEAAETCAAEALTIAERVCRPWERATALGSAGILHRAKCDYETAAQYFQEELATWRLSGDAWMMAASAADTAEAELHRGNVDTARTLTLEVLQTADPDDAILAWNLRFRPRYGGVRARRQGGVAKGVMSVG